MLRGLFARECGEDYGFVNELRGVRWSNLYPDAKRIVNAAVDVSIDALDIDTCTGQMLLCAGYAPGEPSKTRGAVGIFTTTAAGRAASAAPTVFRSGAGVGERVSQIRWLPHDVGLFVTGHNFGKLTVWDTELFEQVATFSVVDNGVDISNAEPGKEYYITSAHMSQAPGAQAELVAASALDYGQITLVDLESGAATHRLQGHSGTVNEVRWSPTNPFHLASCGSDGTARLFDVRRAGSAACLTVFDMYNKLPKPAFEYKRPALRQPQKKRKTGTKPAPTRAEQGDHLRPLLGLHMAWEDAADSSIRAQRLRRKRLSTANQVKRKHAHSGGADCIRFTYNGCFLVTAGRNGRFRLWDVLTSHCIRESYRNAGRSGSGTHKREDVMFELSTDSSCVLSTYDESLNIHDVHSGELLARRRGHFTEMSAMAVHPFHEELYTASGAEMICWAPPGSLNSYQLGSHAAGSSPN